MKNKTHSRFPVPGSRLNFLFQPLAFFIAALLLLLAPRAAALPTVSDLTLIGAGDISTADLLYVVNSEATGAGKDRKMTLAQLTTYLSGLISGAVADGSITSAKIADGAIVNADVNASAGISLSKLAALTASRLVVSDGSGVLTPSSVTSTEAGYLSGVTSAIQTQVDAKAPLASPTFTGTVTIPTGASIAGSTVTTLHTAYLTSLWMASLNSMAGEPPDSVIMSNGLGAFTSLLSGVTGRELMQAASQAAARTTLGLGSLATLSGVASAQITDGTIMNADVNASAAIALSKLATDPLARANHTGTQAVSTISGLGTGVGTALAAGATAGADSGSVDHAGKLLLYSANSEIYARRVTIVGSGSSSASLLEGILTISDSTAANIFSVDVSAATSVVAGSSVDSGSLQLKGTSGSTPGLVQINPAGGHVAIGGGASATEMRLLEPSGSGTNYTGFVSPALAGNVIYTMPTADGAANTALVTNGSKVLSWTASAPALLTANNFIGVQTIALSALGTTTTAGVSLINATDAALGAQQVSPSLILQGEGWRSGNSTNHTVGYQQYVLPIQGASANPTARLHINPVIDGVVENTGGLVIDTGDGGSFTNVRASSGNGIIVADNSGGHGLYISHGAATVRFGLNLYPSTGPNFDLEFPYGAGISSAYTVKDAFRYGGDTYLGRGGAVDSMQIGLDGTTDANASDQLFKANDALAGTATNRDGGDLTIGTGLSTGSGTASIVFQTTNNIAAATAANTSTERARINSSGLTIGSGGTAIVKVLSATAVLDFADQAPESQEDLSITVTGAAEGDPVFIAVPNASNTSNVNFRAWVSAADTVTVRFTHNDDTGDHNPDSGTFRATVIKH